MKRTIPSAGLPRVKSVDVTDEFLSLLPNTIYIRCLSKIVSRPALLCSWEITDELPGFQFQVTFLSEMLKMLKMLNFLRYVISEIYYILCS